MSDKAMRYIPAFFLSVFVIAPVSAEKTYTFITDTGYYFATSHEGKMNAAADLLTANNIEGIPYELGPWEGYELEYDDENLIFFRAYVNSVSGDKIYFIAVRGTVESKFHTPEVCYINDNWQVNKRGYAMMRAGAREFETRYFTAVKKKWRHCVRYWFMWKDSRRLMDEGCAMFRVAAGMDNISEAKAKANTADFITNMLNYGGVAAKESAAAAPVEKAELILANKNSPYYRQREKAVRWLMNQKVPNDAVQKPANTRRNLILSYELDKNAQAYKFIFSRSSLYDNGVAVIALTIERQFEEAGEIIDAVMRMGGRDGELFFTFNTHNNWPGRDDSMGAIIRTGASAWAGYSIVFYLRARMLEDPGIIAASSELIGYLEYAKVIADKILERRIIAKNDARYGLVTGGKGTYVLEMNRAIDKVEEKFQPDEVEWCSIEHNIDAYYFLRDLGKISKDKKYIRAAKLLGKRLVEQCWNEDMGQFNRGQDPVKQDDVKALDCASWGSVLLNSMGKKQKAAVALKATGNYLTDDGNSYKPYVDKKVYGNFDVSSYYFPEKPYITWKNINLMWAEGALGVAFAYLRNGEDKRGEEIIKETLKYSAESGGIAYSSVYIAHEFSQAPSVASTGWFLIAAGNLEDNKIARLFWD